MNPTTSAAVSSKTQPACVYSLIRRLWPWLAALASGGLLVLCFAPWNQQWLCWCALTPLICALWFGGERNAPNAAAAAEELPPMDPPATPPGWRSWLWRAWRGPRVVLRGAGARGFFLGYAAGLVFFWGAFYWLWEVTGIGWFILAFYMALYFAVWGGFVATVGRPRAANPAEPSPFLRSRWNLWFAFLAAACWVAHEWVRGWMFSGFGWNDVGVGLHASLPLIQIAEWTGVGGVSFIAVFANVIAVATVYRFFLEVRIQRVRPHFDFTLTIAGLVAVFAFGVHRIQTIDRQSAQPDVSIPLRVAAVQADVERVERWTPELGTRIFDKYRQLTNLALANHPQLLLWPESSTILGMFADRTTYEFVRDTAKQAPDTNLLLGTLDVDFDEYGKWEADYNAAALMPAGGGDVEVYRKIHLVPFGEYIPFRKSFPLFAWIIGDQVPGDFGAGTVPAVFRLRSPNIGAAPLICFEDTLGRLVRQPVLQGAQLLVNITNDVWFGRTAAPEQHLAEAVFRTVENRRPLVRCANTGVTAFVDTTGRVTDQLRSPENGSVFTTGVLFGKVKVPAQPVLTFYSRNGEVFSIACGLAVILATFLGWRRRRTPAAAKELMLDTGVRETELETAR